MRASRENADTNGIAPERFAIGLGSVTEILEGKFPIRQARLVLANILAPVIIRLFGMGLADLVARGRRADPVRNPGRAGRGGPDLLHRSMD